MQSSSNTPAGSWYDTPLGRLHRAAGRRSTQPSVAEVMAELTGRRRATVTTDEADR
jgi:hypothetical protein